MKQIIIFILFLGPYWLAGQETSTEELRAKGYQAKMEGDYNLAIQHYEAILKTTMQHWQRHGCTRSLKTMIRRWIITKDC